METTVAGFVITLVILLLLFIGLGTVTYGLFYGLGVIVLELYQFAQFEPQSAFLVLLVAVIYTLRNIRREDG
jgi:anaerobic C4-dicarboxylate transporter